jgi:hypothetical protein
MPSPLKLGVLYPFKLTDAMRDAILAGYGIQPTDTTLFSVCDKVGIDLNGQALQNGVDTLLNNGCKVIAAVGGLHVHKAINGFKTDKYTFVSLVGGVPGTPGHHNRGGGNLHTPDSNGDRIKALRNKGLTNSQIGLYRDPAFSDKSTYDTAIATHEESNWNTNSAWQGGSHGPILKSTRNFAADFADNSQLLSGIRGVVISASPFFLSTLTDQTSGMPNTNAAMNIALSANAWVSGGGTGANRRFVIYPFQEYKSAGTGNGIMFVGPDLTKSLKGLGKKAKDGHAGDAYEDQPDASS